MAGRNQVCISIDFGGTKLLIGAVTETGEILASKTLKTGFTDQQEAADFILETLDSFLHEHCWGNEKVCAVGMGLVGRVDPLRGMWEGMYNPEERLEIPIADMVQRAYGVCCAIDNDVKAALMAEIRMGTGTKCQNFAYVNIGTGIAAGFVCDGRILRGHLNDAGEIGFYSLNNRDGGSDCPCMGNNVEDMASGRGMLCRFRSLARIKGTDGDIFEAEQADFNTARLFELNAQGNALAAQIIDDAADALVTLISNIFCTCAPEIIVFGGGVMRNGYLLERACEKLPNRLLTSDLKIGLTQLDASTIGLIGASILGYEKVREEH